MLWREIEGKTIVSVVPDQVPISEYREPVSEDEIWTYAIVLTFSDGSRVRIEGLRHDEVGGIHMEAVA